MENYKNVLDRVFEETGLTYNHSSLINWTNVSSKDLSETFIDEFANYLDWVYISKYKTLSEDFIMKYKDKINWSCISRYQKLSENFIREFQNEVYWSFISQYQILSENFIREFKEKVVWETISIYQKLSEDFIREFKNEVYWCYITAYQKLSEDFIREFKDRVCWAFIFKYQKLSEDFINEFKNRDQSTNVFWFQKLSDSFFKKLDIKKPSYLWLYKDVEFKKKQVVNAGLYECYDDYFIAYKSIRKDRYSFFNFQYQYLKGETYECHCDTSEVENSFGLSAWTEEEAKNYNDGGIIVKVKIKYEDVGRIIHDGGKIRCFKFEVLD